MAFVTRTRILLVASGTPAAPVAVAPTVFRTSAVGQIAADIPAAMLLVPPATRPPQTDWWMYALQWEIQSSIVPTMRGVVPDTGRLVFDVACWDTPAARLAALGQPQRRNTFVHEFTSKRLAGAGPEVRAAIDDYLLRAELGNYPPDGRDLRIATTTDPTHDPLGLLTRPALVALDGAPIDLAARWRAQEG